MALFSCFCGTNRIKEGTSTEVELAKEESPSDPENQGKAVEIEEMEREGGPVDDLMTYYEKRKTGLMNWIGYF